MLTKSKYNNLSRTNKPSNEILNKLNDTNTDEGFDYEFDKIDENKGNTNLSKISWKHSSIKKKLYEKNLNFQIIYIM